MENPFDFSHLFKTFSPLERQATFQVMNSVMIVDKDIDPREKQAIGEISSLMGLTQYDIIASRSLSKETMTKVIRAMPDEKRFLVARALSTIALSDGKVLNIEEAFVQYMAKELNLDREWF